MSHVTRSNQSSFAGSGLLSLLGRNLSLEAHNLRDVRGEIRCVVARADVCDMTR